MNSAAAAAVCGSWRYISVICLRLICPIGAFGFAHWTDWQCINLFVILILFFCDDDVYQEAEGVLQLHGKRRGISLSTSDG